MRLLASTLTILALLGCQQAGPPEVSRQANGMLAIGSGMPELKGVDFDGNAVSSADWAGKTVLLNTWFFE